MLCMVPIVTYYEGIPAITTDKYQELLMIQFQRFCIQLKGCKSHRNDQNEPRLAVHVQRSPSHGSSSVSIQSLSLYT